MARLFNGTSDKIVASTYSAVQLTNSSPFTISAFFYITVSQTGLILNFQQNVSGQYFFELFVSKSASNLFLTGAVGRQNTGQNNITGGTNLSLNKWYHGILTFDTITENIYVNAVSDAAGVTYTQGAGTAAAGNINIAQAFNGTSFFGGRLAECALWNVVLSAGERAALASGVPPSRIRTNNLIMYYPLWGLDSPAINLAPLSTATDGVITGTTVASHAPVARYSSGARGQYSGSVPSKTGSGGGGFNALLLQKYFDKKYTKREQELQIREEVNSAPVDIHLTASRTREIVSILHLDIMRKRTESISLLNSVPKTAFQNKTTDFDLKFQVSRILYNNPRLLMMANRIKSYNNILEISVVPTSQSDKEEKPLPKRESIKELIDDLRLLDSLDS